MYNNKPNYFRLIDDNEIEQIREAALRILCDSGFRIQNRTILEKLEKRGCKVDYPRETVAVTPELFAELEKCAKKPSPWPKPEEIILRRPLPGGYSLGRNITNYYDWQKGEKRQAAMADNENIIKACHMIPEVTALAPMFAAQDVPPPIEPIAGVALAMKLTDKPFGGIELMMPGQLPYMEELYTIKNGKETRITASFASMTRFTLDSRAAACLEEVHTRNGLTWWGSNSCPIAGMSSPVTIAGSAAIGMAEMIGGWIPGWALNENVSLGCIPVSGTLDMRTTRILFSSPEAILIDAAISQVFGRLYGMNVAPEVSATYVDGKVPGIQAVHDKVYKSLSFLSLTGSNVGVHFGMLESGTTISPAQLMLDLEINRGMELLTRGFEVNAQTLALDVIEEVGVHGDFLTADHTLDNFRQALWHPQLLDRTAFADSIIEGGKERDVLQKAQDRYDSALKGYEPIDMGDDKLLAIEDVVSRAEKALL